MPSNKRFPLIWAVLLAVFVTAAPSKADSQSMETLLAYLKSPNSATRADAARKLGERRSRNQLVVEALAVAASKDDSAKVRVEAVRALGLLKDYSALPEMIGALKDSDPDVRQTGVRALVSLYTEQGTDFITNKRSGWNLLNPFLDTDDREIIEPYVAVEPTIVDALGDTARNDRDRDVRIAAVRALGVLRGTAAIPKLAQALNADADMRIDVIRTFIKIGDTSSGQHLIPFFSDSDAKVRTQAMVAAGLLKYRPAVEPLLSVYGLGPESKGTLKTVTGKVKGLFRYLPPRDEAALWALSLIGDEKAEQTFVENIGDPDSERRQYAFEGLARIAEPRYLDQITRLVLTEKDKDVKLAQYWAMYKMGSRPHIRYVVNRLDSGQKQQARDYLMESDDPAHLHPFVRADNKTVRREVIDVLGRIGNQDTIRELETLTRASGARTADDATVAIKRIEWKLAGGPRAVDDGQKSDLHSRPRRTSNP